MLMKLFSKSSPLGNGFVKSLVSLGVNSLTKDKIFDQSNLKDDKIKVTNKMNFVVGKVENIVGKGENAGYHNVFKRPLCQAGQKS